MKHTIRLASMGTVQKLSLMLLIVLISFLNLTTFSVSQTLKLENQYTKRDDKDQTSIPTFDMEIYPGDPYDSLASMYIPASAAGVHDAEIVKNGQKSCDGLQDGLYSGGYQQGYYGGSPVGYGNNYQFPGGIFGFPRGIFGFPGSILGFPRGIFGLPGGSIFGFPVGYGGGPGGYGGGQGGYGGGPGGYGGGPGGGYGGGGPGNKPGGGAPGYGARAEVKREIVSSHD